MSTLKLLQHSNILEKPNKLDSIYAEGLSIEYLTPAWAARLTTASGWKDLNILRSLSSSSKSVFINYQFACGAVFSLFNISNLLFFK